MPLVSLQAVDITKTFSRRNVFSGVNVSVAQSQTLAIIGRNGSGKSTLVKILAGVLSATSGNVIITLDGRTIERTEVFNHIGFVAPYLQLYDEFTALENLMLFKRLRGTAGADNAVHELLKRVGLYSRRDDIVRTFSSGMKQRLKYAFALLHRPPVLILDEPRTNLDSEGIDVVYALIDEQRARGLTIIASNDREDTELCDSAVNLNGSPAPVAGGTA
jgi:heme exporter protein A